MELLRELYKISSPSRGEKKMKKFVKKWIKDNVPEAMVSNDNAGNLYVVKGNAETYPCIVAHLDQVQDPHEKDFCCYVVDGKVFGFCPSKVELRGLGADDKNGIWVALKCLQKYDAMKCAFFVGEEIGCVGSSKADIDFFRHCRWVVQCDRKNGSDLITDAGWTELCSRDFVVALSEGMEKYGYKETDGLMTDVMTLKESGLDVSCVNMSCGYYRPHTEEEYTDLAELQNCLEFVEWIVENVTDVYPHEYEPKSWKSYGGYGGYGKSYGGYGKYDWYDDDEVQVNTNVKVNTGNKTQQAIMDSEAYDYVFDWVTYDPGVNVEEIKSRLEWYGLTVSDDVIEHAIDDAFEYLDMAYQESENENK